MPICRVEQPLLNLLQVCSHWRESQRVPRHRLSGLSRLLQGSSQVRLPGGCHLWEFLISCRQRQPQQHAMCVEKLVSCCPSFAYTVAHVHQVGQSIFQHTMCGEKLVSCWPSFAHDIMHVHQVGQSNFQMLLKIWTAVNHKHNVLTGC